MYYQQYESAMILSFKLLNANPAQLDRVEKQLGLLEDWRDERSVEL